MWKVSSVKVWITSKRYNYQLYQNETNFDLHRSRSWWTMLRGICAFCGHNFIRNLEYSQWSKIDRTRAQYKFRWSPIQFWCLLWTWHLSGHWKFSLSQRRCLQYESCTTRGMYQIIFWTVLCMHSCAGRSPILPRRSSKLEPYRMCY